MKQWRILLLTVCVGFFTIIGSGCGKEEKEIKEPPKEVLQPEDASDKSSELNNESKDKDNKNSTKEILEQAVTINIGLKMIRIIQLICITMMQLLRFLDIYPIPKCGFQRILTRKMEAMWNKIFGKL